MTNEPRTLMEAIRYFEDPDISLKTMVELRWPNGVHCPTCGRTDVRFIATRRLWECKEKHPKRQFSAKLGTIFEDSPLGLDKWFTAIWMIANCKNGVSSYELHRALGVTQKTGWFMLHRIRLAMQAGSIVKMDGEVEADEAYIGGLPKNMHEHKRAKAKKLGRDNKAVAFGLLRRSPEKGKSKVRVIHVPNTQKPTLQAEIRAAVALGSDLYTDAWTSYRGLNGEYRHEVVNHMEEFVRGRVHTNGIENFWSLLKRTLKGTYISVEPFHLGRYLGEQAFRFNERDKNDGIRFRTVLSSVAGKRITYKQLTGYDAEIAPI
jgi:transposase-like protein